MPYIITATRVAERDFEGEPLHTVTRRAVATLDEVREESANEIRRKYNVLVPDNPFYDERAADACHQALALPEAGGTLGPLPDGTMIEVTPITWASIMSAQMIQAGAYDAAIDAYNSFEAYTAKDG